MEFRIGIQEVITEEVLSFFNSSSSTDRPNLGYHVIAEFSKKLSIAVMAFLDSNVSRLPTASLSKGVNPSKSNRRARDESGSEDDSLGNSSAVDGTVDSDYDGGAKGNRIKSKKTLPNTKSQSKKDNGAGSSKNALKATSNRVVKSSRDTIPAKEKGRKRTQDAPSSSEGNEESSNESDSDNDSESNFYTKATKKGLGSKKIVRQKMQRKAPIPPKPFKSTQIVKDGASAVSNALESAHHDKDYMSTGPHHDEESLSDGKKVLPTTYRDVTHVTNDEGKRRKLSPSARNRLEDEAWEKYFIQLINWHAIHGTYNVPFQTKVEDDEHIYMLYDWLRLQHSYMNEYYSFDPAKYHQLSELMGQGLWTEDTGTAASSSSARPAAAVGKSRDTPASSSFQAASREVLRTSAVDGATDSPAAKRPASTTTVSTTSSSSVSRSHLVAPSAPRPSHVTSSVETNQEQRIFPTAPSHHQHKTSLPPVGQPASLLAPPRGVSSGAQQALPAAPVLPGGASLSAPPSGHSFVTPAMSSSSLQMLKPKLLPTSRLPSQLPPRSIMPSTGTSAPAAAVDVPTSLPLEQHPISSDVRKQARDASSFRPPKDTSNLAERHKEEVEMSANVVADEKPVMNSRASLGFGMQRKSLPSTIWYRKGTGTDSENEDGHDSGGGESEATADDKFDSDDLRRADLID